MAGSEFRGQSSYILAPGESIAAVIINQPLRGCPQISELTCFYTGFFGFNSDQCGLCHAAARLFFFEIGQSLIIIRRVSLFVG
jgi:hypothetical protein